MIACCGWVGGGALGCPDPTAASGEDVFFEEALTNDLFQVLLEALAVDDFAPHTVGKSNILLLLGGGVVMNWSRTSDPWLDLDNVEDLVDGESQRSEVFC